MDKEFFFFFFLITFYTTFASLGGRKAYKKSHIEIVDFWQSSQKMALVPMRAMDNESTSTLALTNQN